MRSLTKRQLRRPIAYTAGVFAAVCASLAFLYGGPVWYVCTGTGLIVLASQLVAIHKNQQ
jgi:fatty acid desaturase